MAKQIFGFTELTTPAPGKYVTFIMAAVDEDGSVLVTIRDEDSSHHTFRLPLREAGELACQINTAIFPFIPTART